MGPVEETVRLLSLFGVLPTSSPELDYRILFEARAVNAVRLRGLVDPFSLGQLLV